MEKEHGKKGFSEAIHTLRVGTNAILVHLVLPHRLSQPLPLSLVVLSLFQRGQVILVIIV